MIKSEVPPRWYLDHEIAVDSWPQLKKTIESFLANNHDRSWVWRGHCDANFPLTSSLYRRLYSEISATGASAFPSETDMQHAEKSILTDAREQFRLGDQTALEFFAQLQHLGAPTRLIDVTRNPYIATWFACHESTGLYEKDGRLFGFGFEPGDGFSEPYFDIQKKEPFWFGEGDFTWGEGDLNVWFPPFKTHLRVFAQNAGFVFDGVPIFKSGSTANYKIAQAQGSKAKYWSSKEIAQATSVHINFVKGNRKARGDATKTPVLTIKIPKKIRKAVLAGLQREMGITQASLFPGIEGLAQILSNPESRILGKM